MAEYIAMHEIYIQMLIYTKMQNTLTSNERVLLSNSLQKNTSWISLPYKYLFFK